MMTQKSMQMKKLFIATAITFSAFLTFGQNCNQNEAISDFNKAQELDDAEAGPLFEKSATMFKCCKQYDNYLIASYQSAIAYMNTGKAEQAQKLLVSAIEDTRGLTDSTADVNMLIYHALGEICSDKKDGNGAIAYFDKALAILGDDDSEELAVCLFNIGNAYEMVSDYGRAVGSHRKSIAVKERLEIADSNAYYQSYSVLGEIYQLAGNADSSTFFYGKARNFADLNDSESMAYIKFKDGLTAYKNKDFTTAEFVFSEAKSICEIANLKNDVYVSICLYLGLIYEQQGDAKMAVVLLNNALQTNPEKNDTYHNILLALGRLEQDGNKAKTMLEEVTRDAESAELKSLAQIGLAQRFELENNFSKASDLYKQVAENAENQPSISAQAICGLGNIHLAQNDFEHAIAEYSNALSTIDDNDKELKASIQQMLGDCYFRQDILDKALAFYTDAHSTLKGLYGPKHLKTLTAEENIATIYMAKEEYEKASDIYGRSLSAKKQVFAEDDIQLFDLYRNYAHTLNCLANYQDAETLYQKALQIVANNAIAESKLDVFYNNHGLYCKQIGDYKQALSDMEKSLTIKQKLYGENDIRYANTLNNIGTIQTRLGNFNKADKYYNQAEQIITSVSGDKSLAICEVYINKGNLYNHLGQNTLALDYYNKALDIKAGNGQAEDKNLAPIYNNVGAVYQNIEDYRLAQFFFKKSLDIYVKYNGEDSQETAEAYNNLANVMLNTGKTNEAIGYYKKAYFIYSDITGVNPTLIGNTTNNIATAYLQTERYDSAQFFYNQSIDIYKKVFDNKHPYLALIYNSMGDINIKTGKYADAIEYYGKALDANHENFNHNTDSLPDKNGCFDQNIILNTLLSRASAYTQQYLQDRKTANLTYALNHFVLCDELIANLRRSALTKTDKLNLGNIAVKCYEGALEICTELLNSQLSANQRASYEKLAFAYIEKSKSNSLLESMAGQDAMKLANIPAELQERENQLSADVMYYEKQLAENPKTASQIRVSLLNANKAYYTFIKKLESDYPDYRQLKLADNSVELAELQKQIKDGTQLRMYMLGQELVYIVCITNSRFEINTAPMCKNLADTVRLYRNSMTQSSQKALIDFSRLSKSLYKTLFPDSIADDIKTLVVVPDGALNQIPFESLNAGNVGSSTDYVNFDFLIKKYSVSYAYSATLYYRDIARDKGKNSAGWLGMAPVFTKGKYQGIELNSKFGKKDKTYNDLQLVNDDKLSALASSEGEVRSIYTMFNNQSIKSQAYLWGCANKQNFCNDSIVKVKYIHLATHGFVNSENPELSGIQLSPMVGDAQNGVLYSNDVYAMKLNCDLLVLSACETGLGKIMKGEGIVGLSRAFLYAGASNLMVSLWKVSDNSTSKLMVEFYRQMLDKNNAGLTYAELLQKAKQLLLLDKVYSRPYFWAPFIVIGD